MRGGDEVDVMAARLLKPEHDDRQLLVRYGLAVPLVADVVILTKFAQEVAVGEGKEEGEQLEKLKEKSEVKLEEKPEEKPGVKPEEKPKKKVERKKTTSTSKKSKSVKSDTNVKEKPKRKTHRKPSMATISPIKFISVPSEDGTPVSMTVKKTSTKKPKPRK